jgi:pimeloyl-ACP methyl ester carboxylesterase
MTTSTPPRPYTTGSVTSRDGTKIGYRQLGHGPGLVLVHGGMMASQNFMKLAAALSDTFTVYVPDRRGRGLSGSHGDRYGIDKEVEDLDALVTKSGAHDLFGLSSGALIALQAALTLPAIRRVALYEPPLPIDGRASPTAWVPRFERDLARGDLAAAMVSIMKGTGDSLPLFSIPRFLLVPLMRLAIRASAKEAKGDDVPLDVLIPTMHYDPQLVKAMEGTLENFSMMRADVLLLGGSKSKSYLKVALDALGEVLPRATRVEFAGLGHLAADNDGKPERVAQELRRFFGEPHTAHSSTG